MRLALHTEPKAKYRNMFVVTSEGYWGDMDEKHMRVDEFKTEREAIPTIAMFLKLKKEQHKVETHDQMEEWLQDQGYDPDKVWIPADMGSMTPDIDQLTVEWYDKDGICYEVDILDE